MASSTRRPASPSRDLSGLTTLAVRQPNRGHRLLGRRVVAEVVCRRQYLDQRGRRAFTGDPVPDPIPEGASHLQPRATAVPSPAPVGGQRCWPGGRPRGPRWDHGGPRLGPAREVPEHVLVACPKGKLQVCLPPFRAPAGGGRTRPPTRPDATRRARRQRGPTPATGHDPATATTADRQRANRTHQAPRDGNPSEARGASQPTCITPGSIPLASTESRCPVPDMRGWFPWRRRRASPSRTWARS